MIIKVRNPLVYIYIYIFMYLLASFLSFKLTVLSVIDCNK